MATEIRGNFVGALAAYHAAMQRLEGKKRPIAMPTAPTAPAAKQVATPGDWGSRARKAAGYKLPWHAQLAWNKRDPSVSPRELADRQETPHWGFNMGRAMRSHRNAFRPSFNTAPSWATSLAKKRRGYYRPMGVR